MTIAESWYDSPEGWERQRWVGLSFSGAGGEPDILAVPRCELCGRFTTTGEARYYLDGGVQFSGFRCAAHGDITPFWVWDEG